LLLEEVLNFVSSFSQAARMLLRVDDVVQAVRKNQEQGGGTQQGPGPEEMMEQ